MLVLSRRVGERILVGENLWLTVVRIDRTKVRIAFEGPDEIRIDREEILPPHLQYHPKESPKGGES